MADNKKYYYMRLKENFFESEEMIILESMPDGYLYSNILLKLYLRSLKNEGKLMFNNHIPYNSQILATVTRHQVGTVEMALKIFRDLGLIEVLDNGAIYMLDIQNFVGKGSTEADRKREYDRRISKEKKELLGICEKSPEKSPPEIEKEIDIEIEKEIDIEIEKEIDIEKEVNKKTSKPSKPTRHKYGEYKHVLLTDEQHTKLINELGTSVTNDSITFLDEYIEMKGYKARNHYLCIKKWVVDAVKEKQLKANKNTSSSTQNLKQLFKEAEDEENGISSDINDPF
nr:phage replisome organizer N-terminal domain-containing protein [Clostridium neonatale]